MISDIIDSLKKGVHERSTSPLLGSFLISLSAWNYRFLLLLISELSFKEKISYIDEVLYPNPCRCFFQLFLFPLLTSAFIIFVYPYPARWTFQFWRKRQNEILAIRRKIDDETPLTIEESREIRKQTVDLREKHEAEIKTLHLEITDLKTKLSLKEETKNSPPSSKKNPTEISIEGTAILQFLAKNKGRVSKDGLFEAFSKVSPVLIQHHIDKLKSAFFISEEIHSVHGTLIISLTETGRAFVVDSGLI